ncbi:aerotolerance protein [Pontibacter chitinilyticus]|uniref:aerotolerance protein n=1 Tax=Pontibacter chitinilyticus TaxID=2674989 RepID=UPI00321C0711
MKVLLYSVVLISFLSGGLRTISRINIYSQEAAIAYRQQDYAKAMAAYEYLLNDLEVQDDQLRLNLAHTYYKLGKLDEAQATYRLLADHPYNHLRAVAHLQLGNIAALQHKYKQALSLYRETLIIEPANEMARYDYELLKKYLVLHPEKVEQAPQEKLPPPAAKAPDSLQAPPPAEENMEPQPKQKPDTQGSDKAEVDKPEPSPTPTDQQQQGGSHGDQPQNGSSNGDSEREQASGSSDGDTKGQNLQDVSETDQPLQRGSSQNATDQDQRAQTQRSRLQQMNMSPEKAQLLLNAMRNAELQYIQQLPKKSAHTPAPGKPDW